MPFVTIATDAWEDTVYIDEDAWSRWAEAMKVLLAGMDKAAWRKAYEEIMKRLETASSFTSTTPSSGTSREPYSYCCAPANSVSRRPLIRPPCRITPGRTVVKAPVR